MTIIQAAETLADEVQAEADRAAATQAAALAEAQAAQAAAEATAQALTDAALSTELGRQITTTNERLSSCLTQLETLTRENQTEREQLNLRLTALETRPIVGISIPPASTDQPEIPANPTLELPAAILPENVSADAPPEPANAPQTPNKSKRRLL